MAERNFHMARVRLVKPREAGGHAVERRRAFAAVCELGKNCDTGRRPAILNSHPVPT